MTDTIPTLSSDDSSIRLRAAQEIIHRNILWSLGACAVPLPVADVLALAAVQIKLMRELSALYGVPFRESLAKKIVASLLSSVGGFSAGFVVAASFGKLLPGVGTLLGFMSIQTFAGALTYAMGRVYLMHIESGGALLDFDPRAMRQHFYREFRKGEQVATKLASEAAEPSTVAPAAAADVQASGAGVAIVQIHYKGTAKRRQADEYAEIANNSDTPVDMSGWTLDADGAGQVFTFPPETQLAPGQVVRVYTDEMHPESGGFTFGIHRPIWNDRGDRARLRDKGGAVMSVFTYGDKQ
ncbi:lamin tail domain-containing protein [Nannocystis punicea]|uniref:Lamin tail domain-containing protein n=1 Tax=Nannocystis punicea TaxID=2995304 RepID=A0ABY7GXB2_9BACT|nr:lamin tail domain-containing protein [Nannocystis poenicansa]WAS91519.1 lamin tail domain-containing protein [Nannocystis poenicansa]